LPQSFILSACGRFAKTDRDFYIKNFPLLILPPENPAGKKQRADIKNGRENIPAETQIRNKD